MTVIGCTITGNSTVLSGDICSAGLALALSIGGSYFSANTSVLICIQVKARR